MRDVIISLDIGLDGAIVVYDSGAATNSSGKTEYLRMPVTKGKKPFLSMQGLNWIFKGIKHTGNVLVVYEKLGQIFESSKATALSMGIQIGAVEMCCIAHGFPYLEIPAKEWQAEMFTGVQEMTKVTRKKDKKTGEVKIKESRDTKAMAEAVARRLLPNAVLNFPGMKKSTHDGLVDAILIGIYAQRKNL